MSDYRGCRIIQCFLVQSNMVTVPHIMVGLERMLDYRGVGLQRFHYTSYCEMKQLFEGEANTFRVELIGHFVLQTLEYSLSFANYS